MVVPRYKPKSRKKLPIPGARTLDILTSLRWISRVLRGHFARFSPSVSANIADPCHDTVNAVQGINERYYMFEERHQKPLRMQHNQRGAIK